MEHCRPVSDPYGAWPPASLDNDPLHRPPPPQEYGLRGPQVEPAASYWLLCPAPCAIKITDLTRVTDAPHVDVGGARRPNPCFFPPFPADPAVVAAEVDEVKELACLRDDPQALFGNEPGRERLGLSLFLRLRPQPLGAVVNTLRRGDALLVNGGPETRRATVDVCAQPRPDAGPVPCATDCADDFFPAIRTGRELARYFESETPGLAHRLALNYLLRDANFSPPYQALIWAALDVAIYSALSAAWYYKWLADGNCELPRGCGPLSPHRRRGRTSRRPRPYEVDYEVDVLFNRVVNCTRSGDGERRLTPRPSPGTPRHPAYPSGHSTYAGAASEVLSYFFPDYAGEFTKLADNTGMARLWAGIHYRSDHVNGVRLGRCVGRLIIRQIESACLVRPDPCELSSASARDCASPPPTIPELCRCAAEFCECCRRPGRRGAEVEHAVFGAAAAEGEVEERGAERGRTEAGVESSAADVRAQASGPQEGAAPAGSDAGQREQARGPQQGAPPAGSDQAAREQAGGPQEGAS